VVDGSGFTFRHGDRADLERMLRLLVSEPEIRRAAAQNAREKIWSHYLLGRVANEVEKQYLILANRNGLAKPAASVQAPDHRHRAA
jgi:hypothetical protein